MKLSTTDQAAVAVMLSDKSAGQKQDVLDTLIKQSAVAHGLQCEECGSQRVDDNGGSGIALSYCCTDCGHQWSPNI